MSCLAVKSSFPFIIPLCTYSLNSSTIIGVAIGVEKCQCHYFKHLLKWMIINNFKLKFLFGFVSGLHDEPGRLQIRGIVCNVKLNFYFSITTYFVGTQKNRLNEMGHYNTQNICLNRWLRTYLQFYN